GGGPVPGIGASVLGPEHRGGGARLPGVARDHLLRVRQPARGGPGADRAGASACHRTRAHLAGAAAPGAARYAPLALSPMKKGGAPIPRRPGARPVPFLLVSLPPSGRRAGVPRQATTKHPGPLARGSRLNSTTAVLP